MKLKDILNEIESHDADFMKREEAGNAAQAELEADYDGKEVTIFVNGGAVTATIGFDKQGYVVLSDLAIDDNPDEEEFDLPSIKKKAEKALDDMASEDGELTNEIDLED